MIDRFLRRVPVRRRIVSAFLILVLLLALSIPLIVANQSFLTSRLRQVTEVEARADRLLLLASARVASSRVNLMRYIQDYAPSAYEALDDVDQATQLLEETQDLMPSEQKAAVGTVLLALTEYEGLITEVEKATSAGEGQIASRSLFQAYRLGTDIGQRIEQIVEDSEARVTAANQAIYAEAQTRLLILGSGYALVVILALILAFLIQRSITRPVAELRAGADAFHEGDLSYAVPVAGSDELSLLAQTLNELAAQLHQSIATLEQQVNERTRDLERRATQLAIAVDVGRAATSILDLETLAHRVVDLIREGFDLYYAGLFLVGGAREYAVLEAGTGEAGQVMKERGHRLAVGGVSMVGAACAQGQARIALDVGDEAVRFDNPLLPETRSELALPLMVGDRVLGALDVQSIQPAAFTEQDIAVLQLVADQVAVAVDNARKVSEEAALLEATSPGFWVSRRLATANTTGEIVQIILDSVAETEVDGCAVATFDFSTEDQAEMITFLGSWERQGAPRFSISEPSSLGVYYPLGLANTIFVVEDASQGGGTGRWDRAQMPNIVQEYMARAGILAMVNVPLHIGERTIGFISVDRTTAGPFSPVALQLYETLADQASSALERARLLDETERRAAHEQLVREITDKMRRAPDMDALMRTALHEVASALGTTNAFVQLRATPVQSPDAAGAGGPAVGPNGDGGRTAGRTAGSDRRVAQPGKER